MMAYKKGDGYMQRWDSRPDKPDGGQWAALGVAFLIILIVIFMNLL
ncbi:hypothetical protein SLU01_09200 [Sporosarcina luteola]|uniref:Uncharacterized protein n=1 Tax=Sporosarcina luteola TaxID=582850 RepID=A0A511Z578_9BACL|nr:hypothetical protein SLU01_09200 [Sporosarcina luteola]